MVAGNNSRNGFWAKSIFWYPFQDGSVAGLAGFWSKIYSVCPSSAKSIYYFSGRAPLLLCVEPWLMTQWHVLWAEDGPIFLTKFLKICCTHVPTSSGHVKKSGTKFLKIFCTHVPTS